MKNRIFTLILALFAVSSFAQNLNDLDKGDPGEANKKVIEKLDAAVDLSEEQKVEVQDILEVSQEELQSINKKFKPVLNTMRSEIKGVREEFGEVNAGNKAEVRERVESIKQKYEPNLRQMRQEIKTIKDAVKLELRTVLKPDQLQRLREMNVDRKQKFQKKLKERRDQRKPVRDRPNK